MKKILLSLDYELYGNGSGDVFKHIIVPTNRIVACAEKFGARLTIFFEVVEYWRLKQEWDNGNHMGYTENPVAAMEDQLRSLLQKGHDIQLHIHPQWINARWTDSGWQVDNSAWRLGDFCTADWTIERLLCEGKATLERLLQPVCKSYKCVCLRGGGYNVQPSGELAIAMRKVHLVADSSIYPGGREAGSLSRYDFTHVPVDSGLWYCQDSLEHVSCTPTDLMEIPIVAFPILRFTKYLSMERVKALLQNRKSAKDAFEAKTSSGNQAKRTGMMKKIAWFFQHEAQTWDFCLFSCPMHRRFLHEIERQKERDVFVLVGHPKGYMGNDVAFTYLLKQIQGKYHVCTMAEYLNSQLE